MRRSICALLVSLGLLVSYCAAAEKDKNSPLPQAGEGPGVRAAHTTTDSKPAAEKPKPAKKAAAAKAAKDDPFGHPPVANPMSSAPVAKPAKKASAPRAVVKPKPQRPYVPGEAVKRIEAELHSPTQLEFIDTPLTDVIDYLKDYHGIEIQLDKKKLEELGVAADTPITCNLKKIRLSSALHLILNDLDLAYVVQDEVLLITSRDKADEQVVTKIYQVEDLVTWPWKTEADYDDLIDVITSTLKPETWDAVGGRSHITPFAQRGAITLLQTAESHDQLVRLLEQLRKAKAIGRATGPLLQAPPQPVLWLYDDKPAAIRKALASRTQLEFVDTPLSDVIEYLKDLHGIEIQLDHKALKELGVAPDAPITKNLSGISLQSALRLMLGDLDLTYVIDNEVLLITAKDHANGILETAVYPVADLVLPADGHIDGADFDALIDALTSTIRPESWDEVGGRGSIRGLDSALCLVVSQTADVHEQIAQWLADLRRLPVARTAPTEHPKKDKDSQPAGISVMGGGTPAPSPKPPEKK